MWIYIALAALVLVIIILLFVRKHNNDRNTRTYSSDDAGDEGESQVSSMLLEIAHRYDCYQVDDVIIPEIGRLDKTSQIDHILLTKQAIFVIETKNYSGTIYGKEEDQEWTQVVGDETHTFYNPYKQNATHTKRLAHLLNINTKSMYSFVVFIQDNIEHIKCKNVFGVEKLRDTIMYILDKYDEIFSEEALKTYFDKISYYVDNPIETSEEHIKKVEEYKN